METLPNEMLELIVQRLKPQDIAHCSAVCRSWYEKINQDWIWEPFCDPELVGPLRTIPSVATPKFEIPQAKSLSRISHWKLAFLREKHLWKNWRCENIMDANNRPTEPALLKVHHLRKKWGPEKTILSFGNGNPFSIEFFSDTLLVAWYSDKIEIIDVSVTPAVIAAKTDTLVEIEQHYQLYCVVETDLLLVGKSNSIDVYKVDISKKSIMLQLNLDDISLYRHQIGVVKNNMFLYIGYVSQDLKILDLNNGKILKEELCPLKVNEKTQVSSIVVSPTSDFVAVSYSSFDTNTKVFVYCLKELKFLPGPDNKIFFLEDRKRSISLHAQWLAVLGLDDKITIFNVSESGEVHFSDEISLYYRNFRNRTKIKVCNGRFVFTDRSGEEYDPRNPRKFFETHIKVYSPGSKTLTAIKGDFVDYEVINNKFVAVFCDAWKFSVRVWKLSNRRSKCIAASGSLECFEPLVEEWDFSVVRSWKINSSFTKEIGKHESGWYINHLW